jgi:hypothetical protein
MDEDLRGPAMTLSSGAPMAVGMNLESIVDWSPAWTFVDAFQASRPWIAQTFNTQTWATTWDPAVAHLLDLDADGNVRSLARWSANGVEMQQRAGTLMFRDTGGSHPAGTYIAEWDGKGDVRFGFDAVVKATGRTPAGRHFAELQVTPSNNGIYLAIEATDPADPVRNINVWMPDYQGQSFVGRRWQPGAADSPFHPLFLQRLAPFGTLRFMAMQETNSSGISSWAQRRTGTAVRQGSGAEGTPSEPLVNGVSLEVMVALANALDADPWFNMPHQADDTYVRHFATYVSQHLEPGRKVYVEWANEVWNFGWGFEASQWVAQQAQAAGLDPDLGQWIVAGREAARDMAIWSDVFSGQNNHQLVRVAAGWAAVDWVSDQIAKAMNGAFDAIAIAPYITPTDTQRASYSAATSVDQVLADTRLNIATSAQWVASHARLADAWATRLGRPVELLAYEGGAHLDGRNASYQGAFHAAGTDPRMDPIYREYLQALAAAGLDLYVDFQFTGQEAINGWGDFAKLHRMDQPLATAHRYNAVVAAADGSLWQPPPADGSPPRIVGITVTGTQFELRFSEPIESTGLLPARFSATVGTSSRAISTIAPGASASELRLTLSGVAPTANQTVRLGYSDPAGNNASGVVQDRAGNDLATIASPGRAADTLVSNVNVSTLAATYTNLVLSGAARLATGNSAANQLTGTAFADRLIGRAGNDTLRGGGGADRFRCGSGLNSTSNRDRLIDFAPAEDDRIELEKTTFTALGALGVLPANAFAIGAATSPAHRVLYAPSSGALTYDSNGSLSGGATVFAVLPAGLQGRLGAQAFLVV